MWYNEGMGSEQIGQQSEIKSPEAEKQAVCEDCRANLQTLNQEIEPQDQVDPRIDQVLTAMEAQGMMEACEGKSEWVQVRAKEIFREKIKKSLDSNIPAEYVPQMISAELSECVTKAEGEELDEGYEVARAENEDKVARNEVARAENEDKVARNEVTQAEGEELDEGYEVTQAEGEELDEGYEVARAENEKKVVRNETVQAAFIDLLKNMDSVGNLDALEARFVIALKESGHKEEDQTNIEIFAKERFQKHRNNLTKIQASLTPEELEVFGGDMLQNVSLNLGGNGAYEIYGDVFTKIDQSDLSEEGKEDLRKKVAENIEVDTGTGVQKLMAKMPNADDDKPLKIREGVGIYHQDYDTLRASMEVGDRTLLVDIAKGAKGERVGQIMNTALVIQMIQKSGLGDIMGRGSLASEGAEVYDIAQEDIVKAEFLMAHLLGGFTGFDGEILTQEDLDRFEKNLKWFVPEGDRGTFVQNDTAKSREQLMDAGILNQDGALNKDNIKKAGDFIRGNAESGAPSLEALKRFLKNSKNSDQQKPDQEDQGTNTSEGEESSEEDNQL